MATEFKTDIMERADDGLSVAKVGEHVYYNLDGSKTASEWVRGELPKTKKTFATTDGIFIMDKTDTRCRGAICDGSLGYFACNSNSVEKNAQMIALFSIPFSCAHGFNILPANIDRVVALFAARRIVKDVVWNHQDSYMTPYTTHASYSKYVKDAYVLASFDDKSNQTSIKGTHNGAIYDFKNQFYPFSKADTYDLLGLEKKANFKDERRFCLENHKFDNMSTEAARVLDAFKKCIKDSAAARSAYHKAHPELQVNRWEAGYRQLKGLFAEACPDTFAELKEATAALKEKMLPMVYELGFLRR